MEVRFDAGQVFTGDAFVADVNGLDVIRGTRETVAVWDREATQWRLSSLKGPVVCAPEVTADDDLILSIKDTEIHRGGRTLSFGYSSGEPFVWAPGEGKSDLAECSGHERASWMAVEPHGPVGPELWICTVNWLPGTAPLGPRSRIGALAA